MKKTFLFFAIALLLSSFSFAQTSVLNENFETIDVSGNVSVALAGWTNTATEGTRNYVGKTFEDNNYPQMTAYNATDPTTVAWLITPALTIPAGSSSVVTFDVKKRYPIETALEVFYSTNYTGSGSIGDIASATWNTMSFTYPADADTWVTSNVPITATGTVYVGFKYSGTASSNTTTIQLDNVKVEYTVGINEVINLVSVYPNPVVDVLNIAQTANVEVITLTGQVVATAQNVNTIDVSNLETGVYFVRVETAEGIQTSKIIKK